MCTCLKPRLIAYYAFRKGGEILCCDGAKESIFEIILAGKDVREYRKNKKTKQS